jgi:hypothetical protein
MIVGEEKYGKKLAYALQDIGLVKHVQIVAEPVRDKVRVEYREAKHRQIDPDKYNDQIDPCHQKVIANLLSPVEIPSRYSQQYLKGNNEPNDRRIKRKKDNNSITEYLANVVLKIEKGPEKQWLPHDRDTKRYIYRQYRKGQGTYPDYVFIFRIAHEIIAQ